MKVEHQTLFRRIRKIGFYFAAVYRIMSLLRSRRYSFLRKRISFHEVGNLFLSQAQNTDNNIRWHLPSKFKPKSLTMYSPF
jgi:hypothetical protein